MLYLSIGSIIAQFFTISGGYKPRATMATAPGVGPVSLHCSALFQRGPINLPKWAHGVAPGVGPAQLRHCSLSSPSHCLCAAKLLCSSSTSNNNWILAKIAWLQNYFNTGGKISIENTGCLAAVHGGAQSHRTKKRGTLHNLRTLNNF